MARGMGIHSHPGRPVGHRQFNRLRLGAKAALELTHQRRECLIDDISTTGARVRISPPPVVGTISLLRFHELKVYARVMWARSGEAGLRFEQKLDPEDMQGMLWITENRELYERICSAGHAQDWAEGIGD